MMTGRLGFFLLGCIVGCIFGYIVRSVREIKEQVREVDKHVLGEGGDRGAISFNIIVEVCKSLGNTASQGMRELHKMLADVWIRRIALFLVVALTAYSAFQSQAATNNAKKANARQDRFVACNSMYLTKTIKALNARTANSLAQSDANVALQEAQAVFLSIFVSKPSVTATVAQAALETYIGALGKFIAASTTTSNNVSANPYPTATDFISCLQKK